MTEPPPKPDITDTDTTDAWLRHHIRRAWWTVTDQIENAAERHAPTPIGMLQDALDLRRAWHELDGPLQD